MVDPRGRKWSIKIDWIPLAVGISSPLFSKFQMKWMSACTELGYDVSPSFDRIKVYKKCVHKAICV